MILLRFQRTLGGPLGLQHSDGQVRQMCMDHLSFFGKSLFALGQVGDALLSKWEISNDGQADIPRHLQRLLDYLEVSEFDQEARASARRYILCQNFASRAGVNEKDPAKDSTALDTTAWRLTRTPSTHHLRPPAYHEVRISLQCRWMHLRKVCRNSLV